VSSQLVSHVMSKSSVFKDFQKRFISLLGFSFKKFSCSLGLSILNPKKIEDNAVGVSLQKEEIDKHFSGYDIKRLESYSNNLLDYHVILDLVPTISKLYFLHQLPISLSAGQSAILLAIGLQFKTLDEITNDMTLQVQQILALFCKSIRKIVQHLRNIQEKSIAKRLPATQKVKEIQMNPTKQTLMDDLQQSASKIDLDIAKEREKLLNDPEIAKFAIHGENDDWDNALKIKGGSQPSIVSVKHQKGEQQQQQQYKKRKPDYNNHKKHNKNKIFKK